MNRQEVINRLTEIYQCCNLSKNHLEALAIAIWDLKFKIPKYRKEAKRWKRKYLMLKMEVENGERV